MCVCVRVRVCVYVISGFATFSETCFLTGWVEESWLSFSCLNSACLRNNAALRSTSWREKSRDRGGRGEKGRRRHDEVQTSRSPRLVSRSQTIWGGREAVSPRTDGLSPSASWIVSLGGLYLEGTRTQSEYGLGTRNVIWVRDRGHRSQTRQLNT